MPINLTMPALSPTMEEGTLANWLVAEGDSVSAGDVIAEIETDKATMEYEAPESGVVAKIVEAAGGDMIEVGTLIAVLAEEGEDAASIDVSGASAQSEVAEEAPAVEAVAPVAAAPVVQEAGDANRVFASPLARRLAEDKGIDLSTVQGSGPRGRIVRVDVENAQPVAAQQPAAAAPAASAAPQAPAPVDTSMYPEGSYEVVELDTMRKTIARRLTESKQTVPHFYLRSNVELDALLALRKQLNDAAPVKDDKPSYKISVNDMVIKALAVALRNNPDANVTWADGSMLRHSAVDVAVAVAIEGGLITPIVRDVANKSMSAISNEMKDLALRARDRKLKPEEYSGGTTSVSNLGMFGVENFDAVINPPQGTILAVGAGQKRPIVKDGELAIATQMGVTLSVDHRMIDGALGANVLAEFKTLIENPMSLLV